MPNNLGSWSTDDFRETYRATFGVGSDSSLRPGTRFCRAVGRLIRRRIEFAHSSKAADENVVAVFLLQPKPPVRATATRVPMLSNGLAPLTGRIWFVAEEPNSGHFVKISKLDDDKLFDHVCRSLEAGRVPAVIFDPRTGSRVARFYPLGLSDPAECVEFDIGPRPVTMTEIFDALDIFYKKRLVVPSVFIPKSGSPWKRPAKWHVSNEAEMIIQMHIQDGLSLRFPVCDIRAQQPLVAGRTDLEISERDRVNQGQVTHHALLELKVLRSYRASGAPVSIKINLAEIKKGVDQAIKYGEELGTAARALCCFDLSKVHIGAVCFSKVKSKSRKFKVALGDWSLCGNATQYRSGVCNPIRIMP
jgi:hypothetical protein